MIIQKRRINSMSHLDNISVGESIVIGINNAERFNSQCTALGFPSETKSGSKILPCIINPSTRRNAEPFFVPDKTKPMETAYRTHWWTRKEWAGRGETNDVSDYVSRPYKRYPRVEFPPYSVEFTYLREENCTKIFTDPIAFVESNYMLIKNTINIFLTVFGECEILDKEYEDWKSTEIIRLNWDILPPGEYPWQRVQEDIKRISKHETETNQRITLDKCEYINSFSPDFRAYGRSGFSGYIIFGFRSSNCFVLESVYPNNATYVFDENWETLSKLTKAEILNGNLHNARLIHHENWTNNVKTTIEKAKAK